MTQEELTSMKNLLPSLYLVFIGAFANIAHATEYPDGARIDGGVMMSGPMMFICMFFGLLILIVLVLGIFALVKYLRSKQ